MTATPRPSAGRPTAAAEAALIARAGSRDIDVARVEDRSTVRELMARMALDTRYEVCSTLPSGPYTVEHLRSSWALDVGVLRRGVAIQVIYQADAARDPAVLRYLTEFAAEGAQVRVTARVRHRTIIVDRSVAVVGVEQDSLHGPYLLVREPAMVLSFRAQFAGLWKSAHSVGVGPEDSLGSETVRETLEILKSGVTDEVAARRLGVSVRTVRRRVAAVLELLGAASRFEAGVKAVEAGWL